uniref:Uncharacterized protein n=1 Tax=Arundo donax TaxID=35708 RepID=A0A0A8ZJJ8_ARUDO
MLLSGPLFHFHRCNSHGKMHVGSGASVNSVMKSR